MQVFINICTGIVTKVCLAFTHFLYNNSTFFTGVGNNLAQRFFNSTFDDVNTGCFIYIVTLKAFQSIQCTDIGYTTTWNNTFFDSGTGSTKRIVYTVFLFLHFNLRSSTYIKNSYTARQLGQTFLQFFLVIIRFRRYNLSLDLLATFLDVFFVTGTVYNGCIILGDSYLVGSTQHFDSSLFQLQTFFLADDNTTGQHCNIFQHFLATVTEARSLHCTNLQLRTQTVYNQSCQRFAIHIFCNNQQRTTSLYCRFKNGQEIFQVGNLLIINQDVRFLHFALHLLRVGNEVSREVATIELHTFNHTDSSISTLGLFDSDDTVFGNFAHSVCNQLTDNGVIVGRNRSNLFNLVIVVTHFLCLSFDRINHFGNSLVDTAFDIHRAGTSSHVLQAFGYDGLSQNSSGCSTITCIITGLGSNFLYQLCAGILICVCQLNFFRYRYTIFRDVGSTEFLFDDNVTTFRAEGYFHCICQCVDTFLQLVAGIDIE